MLKAKGLILAAFGAALLCVGLVLGCGKGAGLSIPTDPPAVLYIYEADATLADNFETFLDTVAICDVEHIDDVQTLPLHLYDLIIIGDDTGVPPSTWGVSGDVSAIVDSGKPVLGVGRGGSIFLGLAGLDISWGNSAVSMALGTVNVVSGSHYVYTQPNDLGVNSGDTITLFVTGTEGCVCIYQPLAAGAELLGRESAVTDYYSITRQSNCALWGYRRTAADYSGEARELFYNLIQYLRAL